MIETSKSSSRTTLSAKEIQIKPITAASANRIIKRYHYSGTIVNNSQIHLGVFLNGRCEGAMQFGPSFDKKKMMGLVAGTTWNGFLELNRLAFSDRLPRNSESRAISVALRLIKKSYPHIEWVVSFADGTQCGDGTIYRAAGFHLTAIKKNRTIIKLADGTIAAAMTYHKRKHIIANNGKAGIPAGAKKLKGFQLRYVYFLNPAAIERLTVPTLPYSEIAEMGAGMYKGSTRAKQNGNAVIDQITEGGSIPTRTLQKSKVKHADR